MTVSLLPCQCNRSSHWLLPAAGIAGSSQEEFFPSLSSEAHLANVKVTVLKAVLFFLFSLVPSLQGVS